ncbi:hypothetical protein GCM10011507_10080 [Edaphobacter acidisoli]|uniref:histidine kinase n=1 Tax=Edaphobacter acidisoli TaxID=2040573 RepID=A0A916W2B8_9BACT|nr:ATP-binding protein [Edaphobacter acidisoli]GGA60540.1 hypothetical protein GCM10011507_10080 [Edaphobacter acidisoli]
MNLSQFNRILKQVLLLPIVALLIAAAALVWQIQGANHTVRLIQDSDARITQATLVSKLLVDEESGLRGYETTSDVRFLQPFLDAETRLPAEFKRLNDISGSDIEEMSYVADLQDKQQTWHDAFALPLIATVKAGGKTNDVNLNLHGKELMDEIRADVASIIHTAEQNRAERITHWRHQVHATLAALLVLALAIGILIGLFTRSRLHAVSAAYRTSLEVLGRRAEEIYQSEQRLRTTLASIGDGVISCDTSGYVQMMNPVACNMTGWVLEDALGKPLHEVFHIVHETTRNPMEDPVAKVKQVDRVIDLANHTILIRKDSTELNIADSGAPIRGQNGEITGIVLVFRDITLERRTQEALLANEKLAVAGRLAATIAHEIHNPLDSVSNLLYLMRNGVTPEESRQFMDMAEQELARVTQISRAMLGLYRESKAPVSVDLKRMLKEILLLMDRRFADLGVSVAIDLPADVAVAGYPAELRQVFTNLITNAAEAAGRGGEVSIRIAPNPPGPGPNGQKLPDGATIIIADNGAGISDDVRPHLFQPFFTTKGEHGTGLGLWVSRGIISKHGGAIEIASNTNGNSHGTSVSVFLASNPIIAAGD